jgi:hypothetical protein
MNAELQAMVAAFAYFATPATYARGAVSATVKAHARGLRADELIAAADQFDRLVVIDAADLEAAGLYPPRRFDSVALPGGRFVVFDHRPSPASGTPAFSKCFVKGGGQ